MENIHYFSDNFKLLMQYKINDIIDFRPFSSFSWINAVIIDINYKNLSCIIKTEYFIYNENAKDIFVIPFHLLIHHTALLGTYVKKNWRHDICIHHNILIDFYKDNHYITGKIIYHCIFSNRILILYKENNQMESIWFHIHDKSLYYSWDF